MRRAGSQSRGNSLYIFPLFSARVQGIANVGQGRAREEGIGKSLVNCRAGYAEVDLLHTLALSVPASRSPPLLCSVTNVWQSVDAAAAVASGSGLVASLSSTLFTCCMLHTLLLPLPPARAAYANCALIACPCGCQPVIQASRHASETVIRRRQRRQRRQTATTTIDLLPLLTFRQAKDDLACLSASTVYS